METHEFTPRGSAGASPSRLTPGFLLQRSRRSLERVECHFAKRSRKHRPPALAAAVVQTDASCGKLDLNEDDVADVTCELPFLTELWFTAVVICVSRDRTQRPRLANGRRTPSSSTG